MGKAGKALGTIGFAVIAIGLGMLGAQAQSALPSVSAGAAVVGEAKPIAAWVDFCQNYRAECVLDRSEPAKIALTARNWSLVQTINRRVNLSVQAVTDQDHWGRPDRWDLAEDRRGD